MRKFLASAVIWAYLNPPRSIVFCCTLYVLLLATVLSRAHPLDVWHWRNPLPQGNALNAVTYGNGLYVAVGDLGTIITSADGTNWSRHISGTSDRLNDVVYANGQFLAVGDAGAILTSPDGLLWTPQYGGTFFALEGVTFGNGLYVAVGNNNTILISADGVVWNSRASGPFSLSDVAFGNGQFVAVGSAILTSSDGMNWFRRTSIGPLGAVAFANGIFVAGSGGSFTESPSLWTSVDGVEWQLEDSTTGAVQDITYGAGRWVAVARAYDFSGGGIVYSSNDGRTWTATHTNSTTISGVCFGAGRFVSTAQNGVVLLSRDAINWINPQPEPLNALYGWFDVTYSEGRFVAIDSLGIAVSPDGISWTHGPSITDLGDDISLYSVAYGNGLYVVGGDYRTLGVSSDGIAWTNPVPELESRPYVSEINDILYANGLFVAVGGYRGSILTSSNGVHWSLTDLVPENSEGVYLYSVAFGNGRYVSVGESRVAVSTDGWHWDSVVLDWPAYLFSVAFGNGAFIAAGPDAFWQSVDGSNWVRSASHDGSPHRVAFGGGFFVSVTGPSGFGQSQGESIIWTSPDGVHWTRRHSNTSSGLTSAAFGNGMFVVIGDDGAILQSDPLITLAMSIGATPMVKLSGPVNRSYNVEFTDGVGRWQPLKTVFADHMPFSVPDLPATNRIRLYRALIQGPL